jgi:hypothetical protein
MGIERARHHRRSCGSTLEQTPGGNSLCFEIPKDSDREYCYTNQSLAGERCFSGGCKGRGSLYFTFILLEILTLG